MQQYEKKLLCKHKYGRCRNTCADIYIWEIETGAKADESCDGQVRRVKQRRRVSVGYELQCLQLGLLQRNSISMSGCI